MVNIGSLVSKIPFQRALFARIYGYRPHNLFQEIDGIKFASPLGLAAGFDYNARLTKIMGKIGFGFQSVGTITNSPYKGNPKPRLGRLPKSRSLLVNKGYKNDGINKILQTNLRYLPSDFPVGLSIGATNSLETSTPQAQINDIINCFIAAKDRTDFAYFELNISCPNVHGSGSLDQPENLKELLSKIANLNLSRPLFVKFPAETPWQNARELVEILLEYKVKAVIVSNLIKNRQDHDFDSTEIEAAGKGHFSGKPVEKYSNELIKNIYKEFGGQIIIIGLGGIFNAEDAYKKIKLGANLVQLVTGMIFGGPSSIWEINQNLSQLVNQDGYKNISEAVGSDHQKS